MPFPFFGKKKDSKETTAAEVPVTPAEPAAEPTVNEIIEANYERAGGMANTINSIRSQLGAQYLKDKPAADLISIQDALEQLETELTAPRDVTTDQSETDAHLTQALESLRGLMALTQVAMDRLSESVSMLKESILCRTGQGRTEEALLFARNAVALINIQMLELYNAEDRAKISEIRRQIKALPDDESADEIESSLLTQRDRAKHSIEANESTIVTLQSTIENNRRIIRDSRLMSRGEALKLFEESQKESVRNDQDIADFMEQVRKARIEEEVTRQEIAEKMEDYRFILSQKSRREIKEIRDDEDEDAPQEENEETDEGRLNFN